MSYSYSKISTFDSCPFKYKLKYIDKIKVPFEDSATFEKGKFIHSLFEFYPDIPEFEFKFKQVEEQKQSYVLLVENLFKSNKVLKFLYSDSVLHYREKQFYLDNDLKEVPTRDVAFIDGIIDYVGKYKDTLLLVDWKSGKTQKYASLDQLKFYSLWAFNNYDIEKIQVSLFFVEQNEVKIEIISRSDYENIKSYYFNKINTIENETEFKKNRSKSCEYCPFLKECQRINLRRN